jgi:replication-associated recombination protein RarA
MNENDLVDLVQLMCFQTKEQYRAVLVLGSPNSGKTKFAKLLAEKSKAKYIDLLDVFLNNKNMSDNIDTFGVSSLKKYLLNLPADEAIILTKHVVRPRKGRISEYSRKAEKQ